MQSHEYTSRWERHMMADKVRGWWMYFWGAVGGLFVEVMGLEGVLGVGDPGGDEGGGIGDWRRWIYVHGRK